MTFWIWTIFFMNLMMMTILVKKDFIFSNNHLFPMPLFYEAFFYFCFKQRTFLIYKKTLVYSTRANLNYEFFLYNNIYFCSSFIF